MDIIGNIVELPLLHPIKTHPQSCKIVLILAGFFRLLNSVASTSSSLDEMNDGEANKKSTFAKLKSLLEFYQESKARVRFSASTGFVSVRHLTRPAVLYSCSCMDMWSTSLTACGTVVELC